MNPHDDETLLAYVDDELDADARAEFESAMASDAALAVRVAEQKKLRATLRAAFDPVLREPVPERLEAVARGGTKRGSGTLVPIRGDREKHPSRPVTRAAWFAAAASLVLGVVLGQRLGSHGDDEAWVVADADEAVASGELASVLSTRLAADPPDGGPRVGLSFLSKSGEYCRTFTMAGAASVRAGLACRSGRDGRWQVRVLESIDLAPTPSGGMRTASSDTLPESVRRAVDAAIAGEALDAAGEAAARDAGWEPASGAR
ncbi:MAG TPA: hypothetical protein VFI92_16200 [Steroidobacteraceae bacterium]|nr:hypothetical protein [Steroidobacteraceae bacterium]